MAKDSKGNFHLSGSKARQADKMSAPKAGGVEPQDEHGSQVDDGDSQGGSHGALMAMHKAEPGSKHMVVSHDGYGVKSHSIDEQGQHDGPHEDEAAHEHMQRFMGGEAAPMQQDEEPIHSGGLY